MDYGEELDRDYGHGAYSVPRAMDSYMNQSYGMESHGGGSGGGGGGGGGGSARFGPYESYDSGSSLGGRDLYRSGYGYNEPEQSRFGGSYGGRFDSNYRNSLDSFGGRNQGGSSWEAPYSRSKLRPGFMEDRGRETYSSYSSFSSPHVKPAPVGSRGRGTPAYPDSGFGSRNYDAFGGPSTGRGRGRGYMGDFGGMHRPGIVVDYHNKPSSAAVAARGIKRKMIQQPYNKPDKTTEAQISQGASSSSSRHQKSRSPNQEAAGKFRSKAISSEAAEKEASRRHQALEKQLSKAARQKNDPKVGQITSVPKEASAPSTSAASSAWSPKGETSQFIFPMAEQVEMVPRSSEGLGLHIPTPPGTARPLGPEATFTPTAAGLRPPEAQETELLERMQLLISQAIAQGVASTLQQKARPESGIPSHSNVSYLSQAEAAAYQGSVSPSNSSMSRGSFIGDDEQTEQEMSEDENLSPDLSPFMSVFNPALFKSLLHKARSTAQIGSEGAPQAEPSTNQGPTSQVFSEPTFTQQDIPCPPLFLNIVQRQWEAPGTFPSPGETDKKLFNVASALSELLAVPMVDEPLASLVSSFTVSGDTAEALKSEDKKAELNFRRTHQALAWAVKAAASTSFFARTSLLWLHQLQARVPPEEVRMHQDLNKLVAASEYMVDSSLHAARFSSRALASNITSRRLLWLRQWKADARSKWQLASAPYVGGQLFGEALNPYLNENEDKCKVMSHLIKRADRATPYAHKQSFCPTDTGSEFTNRDRSRQQFQTKRPFRGMGGRPFRRSK
ncbi:DBIRD complex subunit ZNF326 isoform X2 [Crotalus tigris]|uniref:DBIRD complex subunit ZNF326 isoform X2 n=1 Tax=Crotalus tigris TaxID=88082 RepID=UPI00192FB529|nr:DBIRD complex subunit ZNF326 isoform X2 [Crotalus tigris]